MKTGDIVRQTLIVLGATAFVIGMVCNITKRKNEFIRDVSAYAFADTIVDIYQSKDDFGPGTVTKFSGKDSLRFCFYGINNDQQLYYPHFAKEGDIIVKEEKSDSFYVQRNDSIYRFKLQ